MDPTRSQYRNVPTYALGLLFMGAVLVGTLGQREPVAAAPIGAAPPAATTPQGKDRRMDAAQACRKIATADNKSLLNMFDNESLLTMEWDNPWLVKMLRIRYAACMQALGYTDVPLPSP